MLRTSCIYLTLRFVHFLYVLLVSITTWCQRRNWQAPQPLTALRSKLPSHLCLVLVADNKGCETEIETAFLRCLQRVATWCRQLGIKTLTAYDRDGTHVSWIKRGASTLFVREDVSAVEEHPDDSCESEVEYPLTPPLSEPSLSRNQSPDRVKVPVSLDIVTMHGSATRSHKRRNVAVRPKGECAVVSSTSGKLTLHFASRASGKPAIASASRSLLENYVRRSIMSGVTPNGVDYSLDSNELRPVLEGALPQPDFMIVHHVNGLKIPYPPFELHGFPPWQITLTEFHRTHPTDMQAPGLLESTSLCTLISETAFCRALDEYAGAQFRLGK
ncbi:hypothetical protein F5I97DRAFT_1958405 [Phlebopus sp. FC_14]|nr:hypothetical protein F5I97DRAFT_1958405 [Phlebopus sp. FC_14]